METKQLSKDFHGYTWQVSYESLGYYKLQQKDEFSFDWKKQYYAQPQTKEFAGELFADYLENPVGHGLFDNEKLIGIIETDLEKWNNRLRITHIWLDESYRQQGYGKELMSLAIQRGQENQSRGIILETQSCNISAIDFYLKMGFCLVGFDLYAYSNQDLENDEVRFEMMKIF